MAAALYQGAARASCPGA